MRTLLLLLSLSLSLSVTACAVDDTTDTSSTTTTTDTDSTDPLERPIGATDGVALEHDYCDQDSDCTSNACDEDNHECRTWPF